MMTPYLPYPPSSGGQVRSYNLIKNLSENHDITLFSLIKNDDEKEFVKELKKYCEDVKVFKRSLNPWTIKNVLKTGFSLYPFVVVRNLSNEEKTAIKNELEHKNYDLIHAETFYVMPHLPQTDIPIILVDQTIEFQVYQHFVENSENILLKPFMYIDILKIKYWELKFWKKANKVVSVSDSDKKKMLSLVPGLDVGIVPNGAGEDLMSVWGKRKPEKTPTIFFQANFDWLQNVEAANNLVWKVFPLIKKAVPEAICWIVGQGAASKVGNLQRDSVKVIDLKTSDIRGVVDAYERATVFVAPLEGPGGTRLKILAAMAAGVPIVTTKVGIEGIEAENEKEVFVVENWQEMAEQTVLLIKQKDIYQKMVNDARRLVEENYSYKNITKKLDKIYREVASGKN